MTQDTRDPLLDERALARYIGLTPRAIQARRLRGADLPPAIKISSRCLRWRTSAVDAWLDSLTERRAGSKR